LRVTVKEKASYMSDDSQYILLEVESEEGNSRN